MGLQLRVVQSKLQFVDECNQNYVIMGVILIGQTACVVDRHSLIFVKRVCISKCHADVYISVHKYILQIRIASAMGKALAFTRITTPD